MTDELIKKADIYANNTRFTEYDNPSLSESLDISEEIKQAYIAGAKEMQEMMISCNEKIDDLRRLKKTKNKIREYRKKNMGNKSKML